MSKQGLLGLALLTQLGLGAAHGAVWPPILEPHAVQSYVDSEITSDLKESGVPGAVVVIVRGSGTILAKGYGFADVAHRTPVDPRRTLFDIASIGKTMTAVVTLQLVQEGRLNLDANVNRYLKSVRIPGHAITLRMLLGHRGGFDSDLTGLFVPFNGNPYVSTAELQRRLRPIATPGRVTAYDNQGYGVIGLLLQDVTGESLSQLFEQRIFAPLGMTHSALGRPSDGAARLARCYVVHGPEALAPCHYWLYREPIVGAGGVAASGIDMAHYMRMLLNGGELDGQRILSSAAFADLTDFDDYRFNPGLPGMGRSFTQLEEFRGLEYAHGGEMPGFTSLMTIYAGADVGVFVSFLGGQPPSYDSRLSNLLEDWRALQMRPSARAALFRLELFTRNFAQRFIPTDQPRSSTARVGFAPTPSESLAQLVGEYYPTEQETRSLGLRMIGWFSGISVRELPHQTLLIAGQGPYRRIGPNLYQDAQRERVAFARIGGEQYAALHLSPGVYERERALEAPGWSVPTFAVLTLLLLSALPRLASSNPHTLQRLAAWSSGGLALMLAGLFCELQFARDLVVTDGEVLLPFLWRFGAWCGAAALVFSALRFVLHPGSLRTRWAFLHAFVICFAALSIALLWLLWNGPWTSSAT